MHARVCGRGERGAVETWWPLNWAAGQALGTMCSAPTALASGPHTPQVSLLRRLFKAALGEEAARMVDINTIDGFQVRAVAAAAALGWLHAPIGRGGSTCLLPQRAPNCARASTKPPARGSARPPRRRAARRTSPSSPPCARSAAPAASALWRMSGASTWASRAPGGRCLRARTGRAGRAGEGACSRGRHAAPGLWSLHAMPPDCLPLPASPPSCSAPAPLQGHPGCGGPRGVPGDKPTLVGAGVARSPTQVHVQSRCVGWWFG